MANFINDGVLLTYMGDDASKWAEQFCKRFPGNDKGTMIGWFANAIEHSTDVRNNRRESNG